MAYRIVYGDTNKKLNKRAIWRFLLPAVVIVLALTGHFLGWGQYLIPGDPVVTRDAAQQLLDSIAAGEPVREAFGDFCREIIDYEEAD